MLKLVDNTKGVYQEDFNGYRLIVIPKQEGQPYDRVILYMMEDRQYMVELIPYSRTAEYQGSIDSLDTVYFKFATVSYGSLEYNEVLRLNREYEKALEAAEQFAFSMLELKNKLKKES